jgi:hypothetical protein
MDTHTERDERANADDATQVPRGDIPADTFSARLVLARHHAGRLSIEQAAKRCGLRPGNWGHWEDGRLPRDKVDVASAVAEGLGIDRDWLLFGGPLLGARGKPAKRTTSVTVRYPNRPFGRPDSAVRPNDNRPNGLGHSRPSNSAALTSRRPVRVSPAGSPKNDHGV